jgi:hypothetical protein
MMNELSKSLVEDCKAILTEAIFTSRWALIEGYHLLGKRILEEGRNYGDANIVRLAESLNVSPRTLYRAVEFVENYPDINLLPMGKNISWNKIITQLLPSKVNQPEEKRCPNCGALLK